LSPLLLYSPLLSPPPCSLFFFLLLRPPPRSTLFPYTTLFRSLSEYLQASSGKFRHFIQKQNSSMRQRNLSRLRIPAASGQNPKRSEEHTSELQSRFDLVCRLLLEKKKSIQLYNFFNNMYTCGH